MQANKLVQGLLSGIKGQLMIHRKDRAKQYRGECVQKHAFGFDGCTGEIAKWFNENGY